MERPGKKVGILFTENYCRLPSTSWFPRSSQCRLDLVTHCSVRSVMKLILPRLASTSKDLGWWSVSDFSQRVCVCVCISVREWQGETSPLAVFPSFLEGRNGRQRVLQSNIFPNVIVVVRRTPVKNQRQCTKNKTKCLNWSSEDEHPSLSTCSFIVAKHVWIILGLAVC